MYKEYPNLPLIEYMCEVIIKTTKNIPSRQLTFEADVFLQTWPSTALGFGGIGGAAMTEAYTTVMHEINTNTFFIFFANKFCYKIEKPNNAFFEDLKNRQIENIIKAEQKYNKK